MPNNANTLNQTQKDLILEFIESTREYLKVLKRLDPGMYNQYLSDYDYFGFTEIIVTNAIESIPETEELPVQLQLKLYPLFKFAEDVFINNNHDNLKNEYVQKMIMKNNLHNEFSFLSQLSNELLPLKQNVEKTYNTVKNYRTLATDTNNLPQLIDQALDPKRTSENPKLFKPQIDEIKKSMGEDLFNQLIKRYELTEENFTLDDLRMLIIGILPNYNKNWKDNNFILTMLAVCKINHGSPDDPKIMQELREKIKLDLNVLDRISKQTLFDSVINKGLDFLSNNLLKEWKFLIPIRFKANKHFKKDLKLATALSSINDWKNKQDPNLKDFSADEFNFNKLSNAELKDGTVIPTLSENGEIVFCKVKNFINEKNVHGSALIPIDPNKSLDIKIVFRNSNNLGKAIFDIEHYTYYRDFKKNRNTILQQLNKIVTEFKQDPTLSDAQREAVSLNIGGHGTGGTLSQLLVNELVTEKAYVAANKFQNKEDLEDILEHNVRQQLKFEENSKGLTGKQQKNIEEKFEKIKKYCQKHFIDSGKKGKVYDEIIVPTENKLREINNIKLSTINAGGIPDKIRTNFIQALSILKDPQVSQQPNLNLTCNKIMVNKDIVHKTGNTDLAAYVDHELMPVKLMKFYIESEKSNKEHLASIAFSAAILTAKLIITTTATTQCPVITPFLALFGFKDQIENIHKNATQMIETANKAHHDHYLNCPKEEIKPFYTIMSNQATSPANQIKELNEELTNKIPPTNTNKVFRKIKKSLYISLRSIQGTYNKLQDKPSSTNNSANTPAEPTDSRTSASALLFDPLNLTPSTQPVTPQSTPVTSPRSKPSEHTNNN